MTGSGQGMAAVSARPRAVARVLLLQTPVLCLLVLVPGIGALIDGQVQLAAALLVPAAVLAMLALRSRQHHPAADLRRIEAVVTLALVFLIGGALAVPAFMVLGLPPVDALFEGISGITTTGLSVARAAEDWPVSAHFLRAWMQWCGGVVVAVAGVALLSGAEHSARSLGQTSVGASDYHASTRARARLILIGYSGLTVLAAGGLLVLIPGWWEGPLVALAAVSTGGFTPRDSSIADYGLAAQVFTLAVSAAAAVSLLFYAAALRHGPRQALRAGTVPLTLRILTGGTVVFTLVHGLVRGWDAEGLIAGALNHVSAQTTAGFSSAPVLSVGPVVVLSMAAMVVGGDAGSTTGGIKTGRARTLAAMVTLVLLRQRLPERAVSHVKIARQAVDTNRLVFAAAILSTYTAFALSLWLILMAGGHAPLPALFDAQSALSGVGLSTGVIGPELSAQTKATVIVAMLAGRLEFFVLIALFLPSTWKSRS